GGLDRVALGQAADVAFHQVTAEHGCTSRKNEANTAPTLSRAAIEAHTDCMGFERFVLVVGVDFSAESEHALAMACAMAQKRGDGATVHAVHAVAMPTRPAGL